MKYVVTPHGGEPYEIDADEVLVDEANTNRVTFKKGGKVVAQENSAGTVRPKSA